MYGEEKRTDKGSFVLIEGGAPSPTVELKGGRRAPTVMEMAEATEPFRVRRILLLCRAGCDDKVRRKAIEYLLKCWDKLTAEQGAEVINCANKMLGSSGTDDEVKVAIAMAMKNFIGVKDSKKEKPMSFEQMIKSGGKIKIDVGGQQRADYNDTPLL